MLFVIMSWPGRPVNVRLSNNGLIARCTLFVNSVIRTINI